MTTKARVLDQVAQESAQEDKVNPPSEGRTSKSSSSSCSLSTEC